MENAADLHELMERIDQLTGGPTVSKDESERLLGVFLAERGFPSEEELFVQVRRVAVESLNDGASVGQIKQVMSALLLGFCIGLEVPRG